eukprot:Lithocolla_globosa_v1_NODE_305_length_4584_cov_10.581365.p4 type:complete len:109 gc:universal NODE_305_length_4584_cov_10.581365:1156-1482(+)
MWPNLGPIRIVSLPKRWSSSKSCMLFLPTLSTRILRFELKPKHNCFTSPRKKVSLPTCFWLFLLKKLTKEFDIPVLFISKISSTSHGNPLNLQKVRDNLLSFLKKIKF